MTTAEKVKNTTTATAHIVRISADHYTVPSRTTVGTQYLVIRRAGRLVCDCDAAINGKGCWHIPAVRQYEAKRTADAQRAALTPADRAAGMALLRGMRPAR